MYTDQKDISTLGLYLLFFRWSPVEVLRYQRICRILLLFTFDVSYPARVTRVNAFLASVSIIPALLTDVLLSTLPRALATLCRICARETPMPEHLHLPLHGYLGPVDMDQHETFMSIVRAYASKTYCISTAYLFATSLCLEVPRGMELFLRV